MFIIALFLLSVVTRRVYAICMTDKDRIIASLFLIEQCSPDVFWEKAAYLLRSGLSSKPFDVSELVS